VQGAELEGGDGEISRRGDKYREVSTERGEEAGGEKEPCTSVRVELDRIDTKTKSKFYKLVTIPCHPVQKGPEAKRFDQGLCIPGNSTLSEHCTVNSELGPDCSGLYTYGG
jgi:hypothetical protein